MSKNVFYFKESGFPEVPEGIDPDIWAVCSQGLQEERKVLIEYEDGNGDGSERTVSPEVIFEDQGNWYMGAFCSLREEVRTFRFDRILYAESTSEKFTSHGIAEEYKELGLPWNRSPQKEPRKIIRTELESSNPAHTALRHAIEKASLKEAAAALEAGADLNAPFYTSKTPLTAAVTYSSDEMVQYLIDLGSDCTLRDNDGNTPFALAVFWGRLDLAEMLFEKFPEAIEYKNYTLEMSPLEETIYFGLLESLLFLLDKGADIHARRDKDQATMLMLAAGMSNDHKGEIAVKRLLEKGAELESRDKNGRTALFYAVEQGNVQCIKALIDAGADVNAVDSDFECTPLLWFFDSFDTPCDNVWLRNGAEMLEIVKILCEAGADVDAADSSGHTALMSAGGELMEYLLAQGACPYDTTEFGTTVAMFHASSLRDLLILEKHRVDMYARNVDGEGLLLWTVPDYQHISFLIRRYGFSVNDRSSKGNSILQRAIEAGEVEAVRYLLEHGANVSSKYLGRGYYGLRDKDGAHREIDDMIRKRKRELTALLNDSCRNLDFPGIKMWTDEGAYVDSSLAEVSRAFEEKEDFPFERFMEICSFLIEKDADITAAGSDGISFIAILLLRNRKSWAKRYLDQYVRRCYRDDHSPGIPSAYPKHLRELQFIYGLEHNGERAPLLDLVLEFLKKIKFDGA